MEPILTGRYQILRHLGGGGFGQTFLAKDDHLPGKPLCVVKQLKPAAKNPTAIEVAKRLFDREAETLYRLGSHDQIPRLLAHFEQDAEFYLVQEYVAGQPLDRELVSGRQLSENTVIELLHDILQVLSFVHKQQVIHRDIKPANLIRRSRDNRIVLIDFGAVKEVSAPTLDSTGQTSLTIAIGSPGYMPSEQQSFHPRYSSDVYAVGIICLQALSGLNPKMLPLDTTTGEFCCAVLRDRAVISPGFAAILDRMVRYDYRQRFENATAALQALQQMLRGISPVPVPPPPPALLTELPDETAFLENQPLTDDQPATKAAPNVASNTLQNVPDDIRQQLERLMAEMIGPIARILVPSVLAQTTTPKEVIERLSDRIPQQKRSQFQQQISQIFKRLDKAPTTASQDETVSIKPGTVPQNPRSVAITPNFIQQCELELAKAVGPIAPMLVQRTLTKNPQITSTELIEALVRHLNDPKTIETFRKSLLALL
jgi:serine/threonine-protein kinase